MLLALTLKGLLILIGVAVIELIKILVIALVVVAASAILLSTQDTKI